MLYYNIADSIRYYIGPGHLLHVGQERPLADARAVLEDQGPLPGPDQHIIVYTYVYIYIYMYIYIYIHTYTMLHIMI